MKEDKVVDFGPVGLKRVGVHVDRGTEYELFTRQNVSNDMVILKPVDMRIGGRYGAHNLTCSPLDRLYHFEMLGHYAYVMLEAAKLFAEDFQKAGMRPKQGAIYNRRTSGKSGMSDKLATARTRWHKAVKALGPKYGGVVSMVVCHEEAPSQHQLIPLKLGLLRLAQHYRLYSLVDFRT